MPTPREEPCVLYPAGKVAKGDWFSTQTERSVWAHDPQQAGLGLFCTPKMGRRLRYVEKSEVSWYRNYRFAIRGYLSRNHNPELHSDRLALY